MKVDYFMRKLILVLEFFNIKKTSLNILDETDGLIKITNFYLKI